MTKLMQWLLAVGVLATVWISILKAERGGLASQYPQLALLWPLGLAFLFALYALTVIIYRVYKFNDCPEAAEELQQQIKEAKEDLKSKGLKF